MDVIPAIDLLGGQCVRLIQGQYDRRITYRDDPAAQAREFHADGAQWLHIVDLDGAKAGRPVNTESIAAIAKLGLLKLEVGGGLRDETAIRQLLDLGVTRVIIGTKAVGDFEWFTRMAETFPGQLVLGLDARDATISTHGWLEDSARSLLEFAIVADALPLAAIIYTDIAKDGMLTGPNLERTRALVEAVDTPVIASGGVKEAEDIRKLKPIGVAGVIVGRSLYEGTLTLPDALAAAG
ncbi:MAG: 1-(5-phosphoribosyl)-5-[(5-phosphoribosylamino)methylideneamino]imidazole-4-carboxamide isomerase [Sedimentisphaerales bacterium]|nr:1-(5-phosphoribosyl)-5-[(5-phosphoribosylamino)methylideneamino]imidazole-4-carboxamide isomerase [Sedimentisphaerales bacterium]